MNMFEEAKSLAVMMKMRSLSQSETAKMLGVSQSFVANKLRLLRFSAIEREIILKNGLTERHARALLRLPDEESRLVVLSQMIAEEMNVKKTEELVEATLEIMRPRPAEKGEQKEKRYVRARDFRIFTNTIKQSVEVIRRSGVDVDYEDKQEDNCCEIVIRIRRNADIA